LHATVGPEAWKELGDLGPRRGEDHEGRGLELPQRGVDEPYRGKVAPVEILEDEEHRLDAAFGGEEVLEGATHLVAHQHRVAARRS